MIRKLIALGILLCCLVVNPVDTQATSSSAFCDLSYQSGGSCLILDKNDPNFAEIFTSTVLSILMSSLGLPTITAINPTSVPQNSVVEAQITASNSHFNSSSTLSTPCKVTALEKYLISTTQIIAKLNIPSDASIGGCDVSIETTLDNGTKETASGTDVLQVVAPLTTPTILSINPNSVARNTVKTVSILGQATHFTAGSTLDFGDPNIKVLSTTLKSATEITASIEVTGTAYLGFHKVTVKTGTEEAKDISGLGSLKVESIDVVPSVVSITPAQVESGRTLKLIIQGKDTQFTQNYTTVSFGDNGLKVSTVSVKNPTELEVELQVLPDAMVGLRDLTVATGGEVVTKSKSLLVFSTATVGVEPSKIQAGRKSTLKITGVNSHFVSGKTQVQAGEGMTVSEIKVTDSSHLTVNFEIAATVQASQQPFWIKTDNELIPGLLEITPAARIKSLSPNTISQEVTQGQEQRIVIIGEYTQFQQDKTWVEFEGDGIKVDRVNVSSPTVADVTIQVAADAQGGTRDIIVSTGDEIVKFADALTLPELPKYTLTVKINGSGTVFVGAEGSECKSSCEYKYLKGTALTSLAVPQPGYRLDLSTEQGCKVSENGKIELTVEKDTVCEVYFEEIPNEDLVSLNIEIEGLGKVTSQDGLINCDENETSENCQGKYSKDRLIELWAVPKSGYKVVASNQGCEVNENGKIELILEEDGACRVRFEEIPVEDLVSLSIEIEGLGKVSSQDGLIDCGDICKGSYSKGNLVELSAVPSSNYKLIPNADQDCQVDEHGQIQVTLEKDINCKVSFIEDIPPPLETVELKVAIEGMGSVECVGKTQCEGSYEPGTVLTLQAQPDDNQHFVRWENCADSTGKELKLTLLESKTVHCKAIFKSDIDPPPPDPDVDSVVQLSLTIVVDGKGEVSGLNCDDHRCQGNYPKNNWLEFPLQPAEGYRLDTELGNAQDCRILPGNEQMSLGLVLLKDTTCQIRFVPISPSVVSFVESSQTVDEYGDVTTTIPTTGKEVKGRIINIPVARLDTVENQVTVNIQPVTHDDLFVITPQLVWQAGEVGNKMIQVFIIDDDEVEEEETVQLQLVDLRGNAQLGNISSFQIHILDNDEPLPDDVTDCQPNSQQIFKPETQSYTLTLGEAPMDVLISGGQGTRELLGFEQFAELVSVEQGLPIPEQGPIHLKLTARKVGGPVTLTLQDCAGQQATITVKVQAPVVDIKPCLPLQPENQEFVLLEGEAAISPIVRGSLEAIGLVEVPNPEVVTMGMPQTGSNFYQIPITPRKPGETELAIDNCAQKQAVIKITVLKSDTLAHHCWLSRQQAGICANPDKIQPLIFNDLTLLPDGQFSKKKWAYFKTVANRIGGGALPPILSSSEEIELKITSVIDPSLYGQSADLVMVLEMQGQFWTLAIQPVTDTNDDEECGVFCIDEEEEPETIEEDGLDDDWTEIDQEESETVEEDELNDDSTDQEEPETVEEDGLDDDLTEIDLEEPETVEEDGLDDDWTEIDLEEPETVNDPFGYTAENGGINRNRASTSRMKKWDGNLVNLGMIESYQPLPGVHTAQFTFNLTDLENPADKVTVHLGYRLENGNIVFNGNQPLTFKLANSAVLSKNQEIKAPRTLFKSQGTAIDMEIDPDHQGKLVDLLLAAITQQGVLMRLPGGQWIEWDQNPDNLVAMKSNLLLESSYSIDNPLDGLDLPASIYIGYRLEDNTVVYNQQPLLFVKVEE